MTYSCAQQILLHNPLKLDKMRHQSICFIIVFCITVVVLEVSIFQLDGSD